MRFAWIVSIASAIGLIAGCQEYNISKPPPAYGGPNPPALANPENIDRIVQVTQPSADVLWLVDNSGSMSDNQRDLANNFPDFMDYFLGSGLDYHIGVVTTDMVKLRFSGKLVESSTGERFITPDTPDPMTTFASMAQVGTDGSGTEQGRAAVYTALEIEKNGYNAGFLRDDEESGIHVIAISDEDDASTNNQIPLDEFNGWMNGLRPDDELVTFNSIVNPPGGGLINPPGDKYFAVTSAVGGITQSLLEPDWVSVLDDLGIQVTGLKREFFLSQLPVESTIVVQVHKADGTVIPIESDEYTYSPSRNSITFKSFVPDPLWQVYIQYTVLSSVVDEIE
jgi:hypothetical protein